MIWASRSDGQENLQPFMVYVDQEGVSARCGPGGEYYRTDPLRHGQSLEVYVETDEGWLGVRPPEGSFCWLPEDVVKLSPAQDFGTVTEDEAIAWVGTHLGKANKYLWQVQLSKGEEVAILGRAKREGPDGPKLWFRIVPPAGEFRWVHRDQVVENPEMLLREKPAAGSAVANAEPALAADLEDSYATTAALPTVQRSILQDSVTPRLPVPPKEMNGSPNLAASVEHEGVVGSGVIRNRDYAAKSEELAQTSADGPGTATDTTRSGIQTGGLAAGDPLVTSDNEVIARANDAPLIAFTTRPQVRSIGTRELRPPAPETMADAFDRRTGPPAASVESPLANPLMSDRSSVVPASNTVPALPSGRQSIESIQLELSRLMARSAPANDVEPVLEAAMSLSRGSGEEAERQRVMMIVNRAKQYQEVARRRDGDRNPQAGMVPRGAYPDPVQLSSPALQVDDQDEYQEVFGHLVQVFSSRPDSPPYALTDSQGRTTHYVSAAPGVNLRRYLNQHVTIRGAAGYSTGLDTPHMIANDAVRSPER